MPDLSLSLKELPTFEINAHHRILEPGFRIGTQISHAHREFEVHIVFSGDISFEIENRVYLLTRGCAVTSRPYEDHRLFHLAEEVCEHYWFTVRTEDDTFPEGIPFPQPGVILLSESQLSELRTILPSFMEQAEEPLVKHITFLQILRILNEGEHQRHKDRMQTLSLDVMHALRYMDERLTEDVRLAEIAAACNVSVNTLERHFKNELTTSPMLMLRKKRMILSMQLLRDGASVAEAALNSGFSDYSHYVQLFKKQYGITPLQYKQKQRSLAWSERTDIL